MHFLHQRATHRPNIGGWVTKDTKTVSHTKTKGEVQLSFFYESRKIQDFCYPLQQRGFLGARHSPSELVYFCRIHFPRQFLITLSLSARRVGDIEKFIANKWRILGSAAAKEIDFQCVCIFHFLWSDWIKQTQFRPEDIQWKMLKLFWIFVGESNLCTTQ